MTDVTHPELVKALVKNPIDVLNSLTLHSIDLWHGATGVAGECGELLEGIAAFEAKEQIDFDATRENVCEELGDLYFYTEQLVQRSGIELNWDAIGTFARNQHIGPDAAIPYAVQVCIYGSQVLDTVKKAAIYNKELDLNLLTIQLTEMSKWAMTIGYMFGIERAGALRENIAKLSKRYEGLKYTDAAAHARADKPPERQYFGKPQAEAVVIPHTPLGSDKPTGEVTG